MLDLGALGAAFPEFALQLPPLGAGTFKVAVRGTRDGEDVVVKIAIQPLPAGTDDDDTEEVEGLLGARFEREIDAMRTVNSPHVVPILDGPHVRQVGTRDFVWYLEPFYPSTLSVRMTTSPPPWPSAQVVPIIRGLLDGLEALASHDLVHRDLKPLNVALNGQGAPVLLDLGAALFLGQATLTQANQLAPHTRGYAAPEQLRPRRRGTIDIRTDFYAVGVISYQLLTGAEHPYGPLDADHDARVASRQFNLASFAGRHVSAELQTLVQRLVHPSPNGRYRNVSAARTALESCP